MKALFLGISLSLTFSINAQINKEDLKNGCPDCKIDCMCTLFFKNLLPDSASRKAIKDNWNDFFAPDLKDLFTMPEGANVVNVKFDGLGCIYPENNDALMSVKYEFLGENQDDFRKFYNHTFYDLFNRQFHGKHVPAIDHFIKNEGFQTPFIIKGRAWSFKQDIDYFDFIRRWNAKHLPGKVQEINGRLNAGIKKVIFFIHGYNVPYSLACMQSKVMINSILEAEPGMKASDILLINVLWPSGDRKNKKFEADSCDYSNIETPKTARAFTYYSNRTYLSAIFLRRIIREMKCDIPIDIITHSHGSSVATSTLINAVQKFQDGPLSNEIEAEMMKEKLPEKEINVFLNAPSIPGVMTFIDVEAGSVQKNYRFFVGYNEKDIVLNKQKLKIKGKTVEGVKPARYLSSTTLGCNINCEVENTLNILKEKKMDFIFRSGINSNQTEHDFFCYVKQPEFKANLKSFLDGKFR